MKNITVYKFSYKAVSICGKLFAKAAKLKLLFVIVILVTNMFSLYSQYHFEKREFSFLSENSKELNTLIITKVPDPPNIRNNGYNYNIECQQIDCDIDFSKVTKIGNILYLPIYIESKIDELIIKFKPFEAPEQSKIYIVNYETGETIREINELKRRLLPENKLTIQTGQNRSMILKVVLPKNNSDFNIEIIGLLLFVEKNYNTESNVLKSKGIADYNIATYSDIDNWYNESNSVIRLRCFYELTDGRSFYNFGNAFFINKLGGYSGSENPILLTSRHIFKDWESGHTIYPGFIVHNSLFDIQNSKNEIN